MMQQQNQQNPAMTEVVDKSLIERLILEHSDRLELEINHKARADAWKFYFRVRIDNMVRPFAVCKVCYRVLHCDSRSGTASLLRHPCNPLSERSPVNRAVRLNAKLKLPPDTALKKDANHIDIIKREKYENNGSPAGGHSPTSTGSPVQSNTTRKRKAGPPPPAFPIDLNLLPLSQLMAAQHPLAALYIANAMNQEPQHFQKLQQQIHEIQINNLLREHQLKTQQMNEQQQQLEQQQIQEPPQLTQEDNKRWCGSPTEPSSSSSSISPMHSEENEAHTEDPGGGSASAGAEISKEMVQHLINMNSSRVSLVEKSPPSSNGVWPRFFMIVVDGIPRSFASCKNCRKVVTYSRYTGTGGLLRHRCPQILSHQSLTPPHDSSPPPLVRCDVNDDSLDSFKQRITRVTPEPSVLTSTPQVGSSSTPAVAGIARVLLRYMCQDLIPGSSIDSPGFQQMVCALINLGASHGTAKSTGLENLPSSQLLLEEHLQPLAALSRDKSARLLQDQPHLSLSCHRPNAELLAVAAHFVTPNFQLKSHAIGTRRLSEGDSTEDALTALLSECLQESPSLLRERRLTVVSDDGVSSLGTPVPCLWHAAEKTLAELNKLPAYVRVSEDTTALLEFLANSGVPGAVKAPRDTPRWEALLHALTFVAANYDKVVEVVRGSGGMAPELGDQAGYQELASLLGSVRKCLASIRATDRPTLNHAVLCRTKLLHLCTAPATTTACKLLQEQLLPLFQEAFTLSPLHLIASFLDPRFKMLKVLNSQERMEVHKLVLEMMKAVSVTDANTGVLNLKTNRRSTSPRPPSASSSASSSGGNVAGNVAGRHSPPSTARLSPPAGEGRESPDRYPFREFMDTNGSDMSVSDSEEIMAYVNMKVHLDDDDILGWWFTSSSSGLPSLRKLARRVLAIPATCNHAHDIGQRALAAAKSLPSGHDHRLNDILHVTYNMD